MLKTRLALCPLSAMRDVVLSLILGLKSRNRRAKKRQPEQDRQSNFGAGQSDQDTEQDSKIRKATSGQPDQDSPSITARRE